ncbi:MAG: hypothetical protein IPQ07_24800 [Myxococcales bacterium]|nr:hypothetical protein [Myxococcales bacterium]
MIVASQRVAAADEPPIWIDDSGADFKIENTFDTLNGVQFNPGWALKVHYVLRGSAKRQQGSTLKFVIKQGKVTSELACAVPNVETDYADDWCSEPKQQVKLTGDVTVDAIYVDGATDVATPLRTYKLKVMTATQIRGNMVPAASQQYVSWQGRGLENYLIPWDSNTINLWVRYAPPYETEVPSVLDTAMFCSVDGKLLEAGSADWSRHTVRGRMGMEDQVVARAYEDKKKTMQNEYRKVAGAVFQMPITFGPADKQAKGYWVLDDHPGKWECKWKHKGKLLRTFRFQVADGKLVPHPEQLAGLRLRPGMILVETEIPADSALDEVVAADEIKNGSFFGRPWATPEGKAMAAAVKSRGTPHYPQPKKLDFGKPVPKWTF